MSDSYILAIDQGTSGTKALLFNGKGQVVKKTSVALETNYRMEGYAEQEPRAITESVRQAVRSCLDGLQEGQLAGIGISNQRETFVLWDATGQPVYPAIVWSCKRSMEICRGLKPMEAWLQTKTGLLADPYFSGTKLLWLLENEAGLKGRITAGEIFFGTVDTWLLYSLTEGRSYLTDHTNASRTLLFNLGELNWDQEILVKWGLSGLRLPEIQTSAGYFGETDLFGMLNRKVPVLAMIGDSHAALFGEACFAPGDTKITMGTGCSLLSNAGGSIPPGKNGLLRTVAWSTTDGVAYAREGAIVACGSVIEWLKLVGIIETAEETASLAREAEAGSGVIMVPAFSGLGAPFWDMERRASFHGISFGTKKAHLVRAALESVCFQIRAVLEAMEAGGSVKINTVAMHGGMSSNEFVRDCLSSLLDAEIRIQDNPDISAQGAAFLAGIKGGFFGGLNEIQALLETNVLEPTAGFEKISLSYNHWLKLINPSRE